MKTYESLFNGFVAVFAGIGVVGSLASSISFITVGKATIFTICILAFYLYLYIIQKREAKNKGTTKFKGLSKSINVKAIGLISSFWLLVAYQKIEYLFEGKNEIDIGITQAGLFPDDDDDNDFLRIVIKPFEAQNDCESRIIKYEYSLKNSIEKMVQKYDLPIQVKILKCDYNRFPRVIPDSLISEYNKSEQDMILTYEIGFSNRCDLVLDGMQKMISDDSLSSVVNLRRITLANLDHDLWSKSHSNSTGTSTPSDIALIDTFMKWKGTTDDYIPGFLSKDPFIHSNGSFVRNHRIFGKVGLYEIDDFGCDLSQFHYTIITNLIKKYLDESRIVEAANIYERINHDAFCIEISKQNGVLSNSILYYLEGLLSKSEFKKVDEFVDQWFLDNKRTFIVSHLIMFKLKNLWFSGNYRGLLEYLQSTKRVAQESVFHAVGYVMSKFYLAELSLNRKDNVVDIPILLADVNEVAAMINKEDLTSRLMYPGNISIVDVSKIEDLMERSKIFTLMGILEIIMKNPDDLSKIERFYLVKSKSKNKY